MKKSVLSVSICLVLLIALAMPAVGAGSGPDTSQPLNGGRGESLYTDKLARPEAVEVRYDPNAIPVHVDPPARPQGGLQPQSATIVIDYVESATNALGDSCATFPAQAKVAMQAAADIWAGLLNSPVTIRIEACFAPLPAYVLGHSATLNFYRDFTGAPTAGTWYPIALANALYGSDLDPASACTGSVPSYPASYCDDISIAYATGYQGTYYYGTDGNPGGLTDFESVVLHEIGHGLGFAGSMQGNTSTNTATWGMGTPYPIAYDRFTVNNANNLLISTYPAGGAGLYSDLTSGNIFFTGANAKAAYSNNRVPLYAPSPWKQGSSYSHFAESFNGTPNALMTYSIGPGESIHAPGPIMLGVLKDVGWVSTLVAAPSGLTATPISSLQVDLAWTDNGVGETGFKIERSANDATHWSVLATTSTTATSYSDTSAIEGTRYYYRVSAVYPGPVYSTPSAQQMAITPLKAVTGLAAAPFSPTQVNLAWVDTNTTESGYLVERSPDGATGWTTLATTAANAQAYNNTGLTEGTRYYYRVTAVNAALGAPANSLSAAANAATYLIAPTGLTATPTTPYRVILAWTQTSTHETGYAVNRGPSASGPWTLLVTTAADAIGYYDDTVVEGSAYFYSVNAVNMAPAVSLPAVTASAAIVPLLPPTGLGAVIGPAGQAVVSWTDASAHETGYRVERSATGGAPWTLVTAPLTAAGAASFSDAAIPELSSLTYRVTAVNSVTTAESTPVLSSALATPLAAPGNVIAAPLLGGGHILIQWQDLSAHETGYELEASPSGADGTWTPLVTTAANANSYPWAQPVNGVYYIRIRAIDATPAHASVFVTASAVLDNQVLFVPVIKK